MQLKNSNFKNIISQFGYPEYFDIYGELEKHKIFQVDGEAENVNYISDISVIPGGICK